jgi:predicted transcriptional regulator
VRRQQLCRRLCHIWYNNNVVTPMPSTSIRIDEQALAVLRELAQKQRQPVQTVLKQAIDSYRREKFLEEANAAFAALRSHPEGNQEEQERDLWDGTTGDGLERE